MRVKGVSSGGARPSERGSKGEGKGKAHKVEGAEGVSTKKVSFIEELYQTNDLKVKEVLDKVLGGIDEAAERFLEHPTYGNLLTYKGLVQRFMKIVIEKLYRVKERFGSKTTDQQKIYTVIEEVDKHLKELTDEVLSGQTDPLNLMAKLDDIRGMLVDLYL
ncbi:TPA: DUF327 domain-containing protein [bacterium]|nr:DUF327 domain-containing protein [bacterium]